jgi:large subunit ribosomal protein L27
MSKTKASGTTRLGRDSQPKYLGVKLFAGQHAKVGNILVRQHGTKWFPGDNVRRGADDTLYATRSGNVLFTTIRKRRFDGKQRIVKVIHVK